MIEHINEEDKQDYFEFLDEVRETGQVNMFHGATLLEENFFISKSNARAVLIEYMHRPNKD